MKKLLFVDFVHHYGGAQKSTIEMIARLRKNNYDVAVIDFVGNKKFASDVESMGLKLYTIGTNNKFSANSLFKFLLSYCKCVNFFYKTYRILKPDFIWTNSYKTAFMFFVLRLIIKAEIFYFFRGVQLCQNFSWLQRIVYNYTFDKILVQSNKIKDFIAFQGIKPAICIVPNVISHSFISKKYHRLDSDERTRIVKLLFVGTLLKTKGIGELLQSLNTLITVDKIKNVRLILAGEFIDVLFKNEIERYVDLNNLSNYISFLGWVEDVGSLIYNSDILVLPSYAEGIPRAVMEAMSLGKCVVVSDVGGVTDFVHPYNNGIVIPPHDCVALTNAIKFLVENPKMIEWLGANARLEVMNNYLEQNQVASLKKVFC